MGITNEEAIRILEHARLMSGFPAKIKFAFDAEGIEALEMTFKVLMQQLRDCKTCKHSDKGNERGENMAELLIFSIFLLYFAFIDGIWQIVLKIKKGVKQHGAKNEGGSINSGTTSAGERHQTIE